MKYLFIFGIICAAIYCIVAFIKWEFNPKYWDSDERVWFVFLVFMIWVLASMALVLS